MKLNPNIQYILNKAMNRDVLTRSEAIELLGMPIHSFECYATMAAANEFTRQVSGNTGSIYSQVGINVWPCPENCDFCYLGAKHRIVSSLHELTIAEVVERARDFVDAGADEVYLMTTANYPIGRFLEIGNAVRKSLPSSISLVANIGDFSTRDANLLRAAGFDGVYHVFRFREGRSTEIDPVRRRETFSAIADAALDLRYCIEPVGPEHSDDEIVEQMCLAREFGAGILSVMRRIPVAGTPFEHSGQLTEIQIAKIVAVARLFLGEQIRQMGVHEPSLLGLRAGAHRICAEIGMNPRDLSADTAKGRGMSVSDCAAMLWEAGFTHPAHRQDRFETPLARY